MSSILSSIVVSLLIGVLLGYLFFRLSKRKKYLNFEVKHSPIIHSTKKIPSEFTMQFRGTEVRNLSALTIFFWNAGNETIVGNQISRTDPLRIASPNSFSILDQEIRKSSHARINPSLESIHDGLAISFDVLEPQDGFAIQILYADKEADENDAAERFHVRGSVIGIKQVGEMEPTLLDHAGSAALLLVALTVFVILIAAFIFLGFDLYRSIVFIASEGLGGFWNKLQENDKLGINSAFGISGVIAIFMGGFFLLFASGSAASTAIDRLRKGKTKKPTSLEE